MTKELHEPSEKIISSSLIDRKKYQEMYKYSVDSNSKEKKVKTTPTKFQEN